MKNNEIKIVEVGLRDGLQNESILIDTNKKLDLISRLGQTGLKYIELTAFVNSKWIPSLYDHERILALYKKKKTLSTKY
jgi:hydroxymethylglutaryl-CoA lyase